MADDWSWALTGGTIATALQNFYVWDGHGSFGQFGYGSGASRGTGFVGESSSGGIGWNIVDLDTLVAITPTTVGTCFGSNQHGTTHNNIELVLFMETSVGPTHVYLDTDTAGHIRARNGDGTILGTTDFILPLSAVDGSGPTYHIECIVTVHNTLGTVQVWVNDILVLDLSGKDTKNGGTGVVGHVLWSGVQGRIVCEVFVHDGSARLGSQWRVGYVPVATAGTYSNSTAVGAATPVQCVDDTPASPELEITNYAVMDATATPKKTSWVSGPMPATALQIRDVHPQIVIEKSDGGTNTGKTGLKSGATEVYTTSAYGVPDAWVARRLAFRRDITAGNPLWTLATAAAGEVIVDRES
jgi:hypothetical protein